MKQRYELYIEDQATGRYHWMSSKQAKRQNEIMQEGSGFLHEYRIAPEDEVNKWRMIK
jgi:hypothetical protein